MKTITIRDIYGDKFIYFCDNKEEAKECFYAENGEDRFSEVIQEEEIKIKVKDSKTGLLFEFDSDEEKEKFFDLWDKYEVIE